VRQCSILADRRDRPRPPADWSTIIARVLGIVGTGLIGGSIGLAARAAGWEVLGLDDPGTLELAQAVGAIGHPGAIDEIRGADLIVLAAPIADICARLAELAPTDALVTDVGSAKARIVRAAETAGIERFVGGHPMAGSQLAGVANASASLFQGARYFLTPTGTTVADAYADVAQFVQRDLGATTTAVDPAKHDLLVAALSHLPHLMAVALLSVASEISPEALAFAGPSFRDLTRVGSANPRLWSDILAENEPALRTAVEAFTAAMGELEHNIPDREEIARRFALAGEAYSALGGMLIEQSGRNVEVAIPVRNHPGVLATVTTLMGSNDINILDLYVRHMDTHRAALVLTIDAGVSARAQELLRSADFTTESV